MDGADRRCMDMGIEPSRPFADLWRSQAGPVLIKTHDQHLDLNRKPIGVPVRRRDRSVSASGPLLPHSSLPINRSTEYGPPPRSAMKRKTIPSSSTYSNPPWAAAK